jgi:Mannosyl-glycoprotein endo-beta-N-acetylglucosaminidase
MPTVIDSLVVMLGLDSKDLESKSPGAVNSLSKIEKQGAKTEGVLGKIHKTSKETARGINDLSRTLNGFLAVIGGTVAIKAFIADFITVNAQLDRLSRNLGLEVSTISAWSNAAEQLGGSAQGLQGTLDMLSKSQTQLMLTGESSLIPYMSALGISLADVNGKARPVTDILLELSDRFSRMDRTTANNLGRMMGIDQGTLNLLFQGRKELELEIKRQKEQNAVTKAQAEEAVKLQRAIVNIKQTFSAFGRTLLMEAIPVIEKVLGSLQTFATWAQANSEFIGDFLKIIAVGLGAIALASAPINLTAIAVLALAAAIALLWQDYQTWKRGGDSLIDWGKWQPAITAATNGIRDLRDIIEGLFNSYTKLWKKVTGDNFWDSFAEGVDTIKGWVGAKGTIQDKLKGGNKSGAANAGVPGAGSMSARAQVLAQQVSKQTGIPADLIYAQWQHETGGFTNRGATQLNNLAGINVPGGKGQDYQKFDSLQAFANYYSDQIHRNFSGALGTTDVNSFVAGLHNGRLGSYFGATPDSYASGINNWLRQDQSNYASSLAGVPGASGIATNAPVAAGGSTTTVDRSIKTNIQQLTVQTQATDAVGIAADLGQALDYLFVSQANYGLI